MYSARASAAGRGGGQAQALMSDTDAVPATGQTVRFDAITGTKSPPGNCEPSSATEYGLSAVLCQHSTHKGACGQRITLPQLQDFLIA